jgi:hypothetical protein
MTHSRQDASCAPTRPLMTAAWHSMRWARSTTFVTTTSGRLTQLPPTFRGVRMRGMKPRDVVAFQGWCVSGFGARTGAAAAASGVAAASCFAASARAADASAASFARQQCLYLRPDPQGQGSLRPGRALVGAVIEQVYCGRPHTPRVESAALEHSDHGGDVLPGALAHFDHAPTRRQQIEP